MIRERLSRFSRSLRPKAKLDESNAHITVNSCVVFFSYFRLDMFIDLAGVFGGRSRNAEVRLLLGDEVIPQQSICTPSMKGNYEITIDAIVNSSNFPKNGIVEVSSGGLSWQVSVSQILNHAARDSSNSLSSLFQSMINDAVATCAPSRPTLLDIGGRARSGIQRASYFPDCDVTTFDILDQTGVDVVGDAHELSRHFPPSSFDFAMSVAVFEHLAMPWKVAVELARVLKPGGAALIFTHQTIGMHDMPWDFFRFSDSSWAALFNQFTGFEVIEAQMNKFMHIVPQIWEERFRGSEKAGGFEGSAVIVRKIGEPTVDWNVRVPEILSTFYPQD